MLLCLNGWATPHAATHSLASLKLCQSALFVICILADATAFKKCTRIFCGIAQSINWKKSNVYDLIKRPHKAKKIIIDYSS